MDNAWFYRSQQRVIGPISLAALRTAIRQGRIDLTCSVKRGTDGSWTTAQSVPELMTFGTDDQLHADTHDAVGPGSLNSPERATRKINPARSSTAGSRRVDSDIATNARQWYCRLWNVELGPMTRGDITRLIDQGQVEPTDVLRRGEHGDWLRAEFVPEFSARFVDRSAADKPPARKELTESSAAPSRDDAPDAPASQAPISALDEAGMNPLKHGVRCDVPRESHAPTAELRGLQLTSSQGGLRLGSEAARRNLPPAGSRFKLPRLALVVVGVFVVTNALILLLAPDVFGPDHRNYHTFLSIWDEMKQMRERGSPLLEWNAFAEQASARLAPIIAELEESADVRQPVKQHLLWAGRDCLLPMLRNAHVRRSHSEEQFQQHMNRASELLAAREGRLPVVQALFQRRGR